MIRAVLVRLLADGGAGLGVAAAIALALAAWARCAELGPPVQVHPAIRDGGLLRRDR